MGQATDYKQLSDADLVILLREADRLAFTTIYDRYWALLFSHARKMVKDEEEARDVVQEVFIYLWNRIDEITITSTLSAYLYSSVRHKILNVIKRSKLREKYIDSLMAFEETDPDSSEDLIAKELATRIEDAIHQLPKKMRTVFELSRKTNLSHKLISEELEISENTIKKQINRALKMIKTRLATISTFLIPLLHFFYS
ncbi:RNA polymerase sigma-70 factor [Pedobacter hiemivivus]|uniref:RNA polymerase sigma-70 factor n=1 Tax=Pedobacter hiemivivus TaxID=2530454 RepID=A0A4U1GDS7_9SPHI|nr:RNA polymerase sigma-70 factor [Pedobacter hiemivivus]TKC62197.1 RNA polymerase sigma-70 factor [Pedobacter hiemivivus]